MSPMASSVWLFAIFVCVAEAMKKENLPSEVLSNSLLMSAQNKGNQMKAKFPFYHTGEELRSETSRLASSCTGASMSLETVAKDDVSIDTINVRAKEARPVNRVFLMCGEHSRELISPESCLYFLKQLCGEVSLQEGSPTAQEVLEHSEFQLVLNANPRSRTTVEGGEYCVRANPHGVDLNRNWDDHFELSSNLPETNPGPSPFSETETRIHRELVTKFKPTAYFSIHSGTLGMYMPWAYDMKHLATRNQEPMMDVLRSIDEEYCHCPYGAAGREVGYSCPGTSMDWVYDKMNASFSYAFEIWVHPSQKEAMESRWKSIKKADESAAALLQRGKQHLAHPHFASFFQEYSSDFVQLKEQKANASDVRWQLAGFADPAESGAQMSCFAQFNPSTQEQYDKVVQNWAAVYLKAADQISRKLQGDGGDGAGRKGDFAII